MPKTDSEFQRVLAEAKSGSSAALGSLYRKYNPRLQHELVGRSPEGEDLAAAVWAAVAPKIHEFTGDERAFRAWLHTFGRRRTTDYIRRAGRSEFVPLQASQNCASQDDPEREALARLYTTEAATWLNTHLTPDQRDVLLLRIYGGLDSNEAAAVMGRTDTWVRVTQHRALQRLRQRLDTTAPPAPQTKSRRSYPRRTDSPRVGHPAMVSS